VEQAAKNVAKSFLSRTMTVPDDGNPREKATNFKKEESSRLLQHTVGVRDIL
jgi:hypothetical protein